LPSKAAMLAALQSTLARNKASPLSLVL
jgi:hypothetical protein